MALEDLVGKKIIKIERLEKESTEVHIFTECGKEYAFLNRQHWQTINLLDFEGDATDFIGAIVLSAEETTNDSSEWTFYRIETDKGGLWMRWLGDGNGYYAEEVDFVLVDQPARAI